MIDPTDTTITLREKKESEIQGQKTGDYSYFHDSLKKKDQKQSLDE